MQFTLNELELLNGLLCFFECSEPANRASCAAGSSLLHFRSTKWYLHTCNISLTFAKARSCSGSCVCVCVCARACAWLFFGRCVRSHAIGFDSGKLFLVSWVGVPCVAGPWHKRNRTLHHYRVLPHTTCKNCKSFKHHISCAFNYIF